MDVLTFNEFLSALIVFFFCLLGVITKDYMDTITGKDTRIYYFRIIIIAVIITILMLSIKDTLLLVVNKYLFAFLCISIGWSNYKVYQLLTDVGNTIIKFFKRKTTDDLGLDGDRMDKIMDLLEGIAESTKSNDIGPPPENGGSNIRDIHSGESSMPHNININKKDDGNSA